jgi:hypothetical protein
MALEKIKRVIQVEIQNSGLIYLKEANEIFEDGVLVSSVPHRSLFTPDMVIADLPLSVKSYAETAWTPEVIASYVAANLPKAP